MHKLHYRGAGSRGGPRWAQTASRALPGSATNNAGSSNRIQLETDLLHQLAEAALALHLQAVGQAHTSG